ncbi:hypothetical protein RhiirB3_497616 [Rhizophagus irregularis]|nr:hypothetical protein RhiirB3_497616 [Rhizophagus irregularis]
MSCDIVQHSFADKLLKKVNILATFFRNNARAGAKFQKLLNTMNIKGGVIVLYCKTRWTTAYKSIDNILRVKAVLENMAANHSDLLTNDKIKPIICLWNFFNELKMRIVKYAEVTAQKLGMDLTKAHTLCSHLLKYKNKESPFDQPYTEGIDNPIKWWSSIELEPPYLQQLAIHLFSICPNSASCERGFSICG